MARTKVDDKLNVVIGTKAQIEGDTSIPENSIIVVTDEASLGDIDSALDVILDNSLGDIDDILDNLLGV